MSVKKGKFEEPETKCMVNVFRIYIMSSVESGCLFVYYGCHFVLIFMNE